MKKPRDRLRILAEVLAIAIIPATKRDIQKNAHLSYARAVRYIEYALECKFLIKHNEKYLTTERGQIFLMHFAAIEPLYVPKEKQKFTEKDIAEMKARIDTH